jgi:tRNA threonylcarbamoyladenosine biosynthesis protein TsaE
VIVVATDTDVTHAVARALGALVAESDDVIALFGPVGAGKTTFVHGVAAALGVTEPVRSPTYAVAHDYAARVGRIAHVDCYRSAAIDDAAWGDIEPMLDGAVVCVEWPEPALEWLDGRAVWSVTLEPLNLETRIITLTPPVERSWPAAARDIAHAVTQRASSSS